MKKKPFYKSPSFKICTVLIVLDIGLILFDILVNKYKPSNYIGGIITEIIGIIITVFFVQRLFDKNESKDKKQDEINRIIKFHKVMNKYIQEYIFYFNCVTTPIEKRDETITSLNAQFSFSDMQDLHKLSLSLRKSFNQSSIRCFYQYEQAIKKYMIEILTHNQFNYFPEIEKMFLAYINISTNGDYKDYILGNENKNTIKNIAIEVIKNDADNFIAKFEAQDPAAISNAATPYYILYNLLQQERDIIVQYNDVIGSIVHTI